MLNIIFGTEYVHASRHGKIKESTVRDTHLPFYSIINMYI